jgi:hypothetical protein
MRYENWDILLFPDGSKVPVQEFKTQCFVTKDSGSFSLLLSVYYKYLVVITDDSSSVVHS